MAGIDIEQEAPGFEDLLSTDGNRYSLSSFNGQRVLVVVFVSNGCPTVRALERWLIWFHTAYAPHGVQVVFINSNNPFLSPSDTYEETAKRALAAGLVLPFEFQPSSRPPGAPAIGYLSPLLEPDPSPLCPNAPGRPLVIP